MKCKEGMEIINSHTRRSPDYEAAVRALKERYDQPRVTSRTTHQNFSQHVWKLTNEGIGQIVTLMQRTIATMKECSVDSLETLYTVIAELHMPDEFFRYWTEKTADSRHLLILINLSSCSSSTGYICRAELLKILQIPSLLQGIHRNRSKGNHSQLFTCRKKRTALSAMMGIICSICVLPLKQNPSRTEAVLLLDLRYVPIVCHTIIFLEFVPVAGYVENVANIIIHFSIISDHHLEQRIILPAHLFPHPPMLMLPLHAIHRGRRLELFWESARS